MQAAAPAQARSLFQQLTADQTAQPIMGQGTHSLICHGADGHNDLLMLHGCLVYVPRLAHFHQRPGNVYPLHVRAIRIDSPWQTVFLLSLPHPAWIFLIKRTFDWSVMMSA